MIAVFYICVALMTSGAFFVGGFGMIPAWAFIFSAMLITGLMLQPKNLGPAFLVRAAIVLYSMTFLPLLEHVFVSEPDYAWAFPQVQSAMADSRTPVFVLMVGVVGLAGMLTGMSMVNAWMRMGGSKIQHQSAPGFMQGKHEKTLMSSPGFIFLGVLLSVFFTLMTPKDTILTMTYGELLSSSSSSMEGFAGFGYMVYILMVIMWIDLERRRGTPLRSFSLEMFFYLFVGYVTVYCNLLRGGRSIASTLLAIGILYLTMPLQRRESLGGRVKTLAMIMAPVLVVFAGLDAFRATFAEGVFSLAGGSAFLNSILSFHKSGAWMGGLFGCYGMADEYFGGNFEWLHGKTYVDYFLSLPPSPIASILNYTRPIESEQGPSWWYMGYTVGGMSQVIVPFKNFGIIGAFIHMTGVGSVIAYIEWKQMLKGGFWRILYGAMFVSFMHWFWYGDMYIIRALMITWLWYMLVRIF